MSPCDHAGFVVRPWAADDSVAALTALLHRAYAPLGQAGLNYTAVDQSEESTAYRIALGQCWLAVESPGQRFLGSLVVRLGQPQDTCLHYRQPQWAVINQWGVEPTCQGRGIGQALLQQAEAWALAQGCQTIALDTAEPAQALIQRYQGWGYRPVGYTQWSGKTYRSVVLAKSLANPG